MERKPKPMEKDEFDRIQKTLRTDRYAAVKKSGNDIQNYLKETNKVLKVSNASPDWRAYVDFVNNRVVGGLARVVLSSLDYFQNEIDFSGGKNEKMPLLEIKLNLVGDEVKFQPDILESNGKG